MAHAFLQHLERDHQKQRQLGEQLGEATDAKQREKLRQQLSDELVPHMEGEEASIFPFMQDSGDDEAEDAALEAVQEHHVAKLVLRELMGLNLTSEVFKAKASVLHELNEHHVEEEEQEHFAWLDQHCTKKQLDELFAQYEKAEEKAKS